MTYLEELDCTFSWRNGKPSKAAPECFVLRGCSQALWWREKKTIEKPNCQAPRLHLLYDLPPHTTLCTLQAVVGRTTSWREEKASKKAEQAKEEKGWKNNRKKLYQETTSLRDIKKVLNRNNRKRQVIQNGTAKLRNTALFSCSTGIQSQYAKVAFLIVSKQPPGYFFHSGTPQ